MCELGKDRRAAGDFRELFDPADAGDEWLVPLLEERARTRREVRGSRAYRIEPRREAAGKRLGAGLTPDEATEHPDHLQDLRDGPLIERHHGNAAPDQLGS